jgi:hypothetical protein
VVWVRFVSGAATATFGIQSIRRQCEDKSSTGRQEPVYLSIPTYASKVETKISLARAKAHLGD